MPRQTALLPNVDHLALDAAVAFVIGALAGRHIGFAVSEELKEDLEQLGMAAAMVAFAVVLHDRLPVAGDHHLLLLGDSAGPEVVGIEIGGNDLRHGGIIRRRIVGEAHEEEAAQAAQVHGLETEAGAVDIGSEMLGECQRTGELVGPAMIAADQLGGRAALVIDDAGAAMAAHIVEGPDHPVGAAHDDDRVAAEADHRVIAGFRHIRLDPDMDPVAGPDGVEIGLEHLVAQIERCFQAVAGLSAREQRGH